MSTKKDIGSVIKSAMEGYSTAPVDDWGAIEAKLKRQRRLKMLMLLLLLLSITAVGVLYLNNVNKESESSEKTNQIKSSPNLDPNPATLDSVSHKTIDEIKEVKESENITHAKESDTDPNSKLNTGKNNTSSADKTTIANNQVSNSGDAYTTATKFRHFLSMLEVQRMDPLELTIDSIQLLGTPTLNENLEEETEESIWRFSPFVSVDHYNAFGRSTSKQNTFNYGAYLYFYGSQNLALRIGYKNLDLQYDFQEANTARQQQVSYTEVPIEGRFFFHSENKFKTSFSIGGSFMFLNEATLIDFDNNITRDNRDIFTGSTFSFNSGLGLHYDLSPKWRLNLESAFKYHLTPFARNQSFSPYNLSLSFGVEYGF